jgi:hypothetical protein
MCVVVLAGGVRERVAFTPALEHRLLRRCSKMRQLLMTSWEPGPMWVDHKCRVADFRTVGWS